MSHQGRVLVVDDLAKWRDELTRLLQRHGFDADSAATIAEARYMLAQRLYHVLVLDIRLEESNGANVEGMSFLEQLSAGSMLEAVEVVMLSAHGTKDQMRTAFRDHRVADFQSKAEFRASEFVELVQQLIANRVNKDLRIEWSSPADVDNVIVNMVINKERVKRDDGDQLAKVAAELDDLLRRLFYRAQSILVRPMAPGHSGAAVLEVQPFFPSGPGNAVVVKFGDYREIDQESRNYFDYVRPFVGGGRHTAITEARRTPLLGGIVYSLLGVRDTYLSFGAYYRQAKIDSIRAVLDRLFLETCGLWYQNASPLLPRNLSEEYERLLKWTVGTLNEGLTKRVDTVLEQGGLRFKKLPEARTFANPLTAITGRTLVFPACESITWDPLESTCRHASLSIL